MKNLVFVLLLLFSFLLRSENLHLNYIGESNLSYSKPYIYLIEKDHYKTIKIPEQTISEPVYFKFSDSTFYKKFASPSSYAFNVINNKLYLNIFKIKYLLISSKEYYEIKSKDLFLIINKFYLNDSEYFILKNQNNHLNTIVTDYQIKQINKLSECQIDLRKCIKKINELNLYSYANNIEIKRQGLNKYNITNKLPKDINLVIPFDNNNDPLYNIVSNFICSINSSGDFTQFI